MSVGQHAEKYSDQRADPPGDQRADPPATWWGLVKQVANSWSDDYVPSMGAALAYYTLFSLAPLLLIVVSVSGLVFGEDAARGEIQAQLQGLMGERGAGAV